MQLDHGIPVVVIFLMFSVANLAWPCFFPIHRDSQGLRKDLSMQAAFKDHQRHKHDFHGVSIYSKFHILQISSFFLFSNFQKRQIALYSPCRLVGRLVGRLTSPLIFSIYTGIEALY